MNISEKINKEEKRFQRNLGKYNCYYGTMICDIPIKRKKFKGVHY